jgi:hypothetical protein
MEVVKDMIVNSHEFRVLRKFGKGQDASLFWVIG